MPNNPDRKAGIGQITPEAHIMMAATQYSDLMLSKRNKLLAQWGMTALQHNALWVLYVYDASNEGLPNSEIGRRLYTRVPDVTRLLDRLAERNWLTRQRDEKNRRIVRSRLTDIGHQLVESAHTSLRALEEESLQHLSADDKETLMRLLKLAGQQGHAHDN